MATAYNVYKFIDLTGLRKAVRWRVPNGTVAIDVGAHVGTASRVLLRGVGESGVVIAIEPQEACVRALNKRFARSIAAESIVIVNAAAGSAVGTGTLIREGTFGTDSRVMSGPGSAQVLTLDSLQSKIGQRKLSFVKIDVQGGEYEVVLGASEIFARYRPDVFVELWKRGLNRYGRAPNEIVQLMTSAGYVPVELHGRNVHERSIDEVLEAATESEFVDQLFVHESRIGFGDI